MTYSFFDTIYSHAHSAEKSLFIQSNLSMTFKLLLSLLFLIAAAEAADLVWYRSRVREQVASSYITAYQRLSSQIIDPLLEFDRQISNENETNVTDVLVLIQGLTCGTKELYNDLSLALNASENLNKELEEKLLQLIFAVSQKENDIREVNNQLRTIEAQLADCQTNVNNAENDVRNKENELNQANAQLAEEQRKGSIDLSEDFLSLLSLHCS